MSPESLKLVSDQELLNAFNLYRKLGTFKSMEEPKFLNVFFPTKAICGANTITSLIITFGVLAHYENGDANLTIQLLNKNSKYQVCSFFVNSKVFSQRG